MNTYRHTFASECPNNGEIVILHLSIETKATIHVEHIKTACAINHNHYHEEIAKDLAARFPGRITLVGNHHGVEITTVLESTGAPA